MNKEKTYNQENKNSFSYLGLGVVHLKRSIQRLGGRLRGGESHLLMSKHDNGNVINYN